ncbi:Hypothetical_protein [Hexamita inflata]|uniref:Hypothetical_protein n=1 Tax=Hexamita inflata TaxID=28002 RepID=A0AA86NAD0_9EUKA|nr:Hypothetical protein HINF_LOCUS3637 [Hexamita inflata]
MIRFSNQTSSVVQLSAHPVYESYSLSNIMFSHCAPGFKSFPCLSLPRVLLCVTRRLQQYWKILFSNSGFNLQTNFVQKLCFLGLSTFHFPKTVKVETCQNYCVWLESLKQKEKQICGSKGNSTTE